jgi:hypothetical protein
MEQTLEGGNVAFFYGQINPNPSVSLKQRSTRVSLICKLSESRSKISRTPRFSHDDLRNLLLFQMDNSRSPKMVCDHSLSVPSLTRHQMGFATNTQRKQPTRGKRIQRRIEMLKSSSAVGNRRRMQGRGCNSFPQPPFSILIHWLRNCHVTKAVVSLDGHSA